MHQLILEKPGLLRATQTEAPCGAGAGCALVRVHRVGVCGTDLHAFNGRQPFFKYPRILGHELGVEVLEIPPGSHRVKVGDRCAVEPYLECGACGACRRGRPNCCENLQVLGVHCDGGLQELLSVPIAKLHPSATLTFDQLALIEPLAVGRHAVSRSQLEPRTWALVIGAGPIGMAVTQFALIAGARVIVADLNPQRLNLCRARLPVEHWIEGPQTRMPQVLRDLTGGELPLAIFDATGSATSMQSTFEWVAHGGKIVFVGLFAGDVSFHDPNFHRRELTLLASRNALPEDFVAIIASIERREIEADHWITHRVKFREAVANFPDWTRPETGVLKAMIEMPRQS